jgi:hypothetical protein
MPQVDAYIDDQGTLCGIPWRAWTSTYDESHFSSISLHLPSSSRHKSPKSCIDSCITLGLLRVVSP